MTHTHFEPSLKKKEKKITTNLQRRVDRLDKSSTLVLENATEVEELLTAAEQSQEFRNLAQDASEAVPRNLDALNLGRDRDQCSSALEENASPGAIRPLALREPVRPRASEISTPSPGGTCLLETMVSVARARDSAYLALTPIDKDAASFWSAGFKRMRCGSARWKKHPASRAESSQKRRKNN